MKIRHRWDLKDVSYIYLLTPGPELVEHSLLREDHRTKIFRGSMMCQLEGVHRHELGVDCNARAVSNLTAGFNHGAAGSACNLDAAKIHLH